MNVEVVSKVDIVVIVVIVIVIIIVVVIIVVIIIMVIIFNVIHLLTSVQSPTHLWAALGLVALARYRALIFEA